MPTEGTAEGTAPSVLPNPRGYPIPVVRHYANIVVGYFLERSDVSDVAVLTMLPFEYDQPDLRTSSLAFRRVAQEFLAVVLPMERRRISLTLAQMEEDKYLLDMMFSSKYFLLSYLLEGHDF